MIKRIAERIPEVFAAACGGALSFFTGLPPLIWVLLAVMCLDYVTGLMCGFRGVSDKSESGRLTSSAAFRGLLKKVVIIAVIFLAALVDRAVEISSGIEFVAVTGATCLWFIASEGLSIVENAAALGVKIPKLLQKALEIMQDSEKEGNDNGHD